jgi:anti-sigma B factor antagonist
VLNQVSKLHVGYRRIDDVTVLDLTGAMTLDDGDLVFRRYIHSLLEQGRTKILLNLAGITVLDSAGVGMLVAKLKTVREKHGDMKLLHMTARSSRVFGLMKILTVFESFEDEDLAVQSFAFDVLES